MSDKYLLGIDLGTSGTKTVLFHQDGSALASSTVEYPMDQPENGWAEQAPEDWWNGRRADHLRGAAQVGREPGGHRVAWHIRPDARPGDAGPSGRSAPPVHHLGGSAHG